MIRTEVWELHVRWEIARRRNNVGRVHVNGIGGKASLIRLSRIVVIRRNGIRVDGL